MNRHLFISALLCAALALGCSPGAEREEQRGEDVDALGEASLAGDVGAQSAEVSPRGQEVEEVLEVGDKAQEETELWSFASCPEDEALGGFQVLLAEAYTGASGQVLSGIVPANVPELVRSQQGCRLLKARSLYCDPQCVPGETCGESGDCIDYPSRISLGEVQVSGLKEPLVMEAKWGNTYTNQGTLPHPGYEVGAKLSLEAEGGELEGFSLRGRGVEYLEPLDEEVTLTRGEELTLGWVSPGPREHTKLRITLNVNNHGSTSAWLSCEVEDSGTFSVPALLLDALLDIGVSGFPSLSLTRLSADAFRSSIGCVEFSVRSERDVAISVTGLTSCTSDQQCPLGESCGSDLSCH